MARPESLDDLGFRPDPDTSQPIYLQLSEALADAIRVGRIAVGARLPSERSCARKLGVSRTTVTTAYQELMAMGLVRGHVGRGTVVIADDPDRVPAGAIAWSQRASRSARLAQVQGARSAPGAILFGDGWLHPSLVPHDALAACAAKAVKDPEVFSKASPILGLPMLREALIESLRGSSVKASMEEVLITGGAQQGLNVIARALLSPGDAVVCESPTWHGAFRAFRAAGAEVTGVAMDHEGIDPDALEDALVHLRPKFVYLIPTFHCPTGRLMSLERRRRVLEICTRLRTPIVESNVYSDITFGKAPPSLKALDTSGIVILQGSASKILGAALRLGWLVAPRAAMDLLAPAKASLDLSTPALPQAVLARLLQGGAYGRHLFSYRAQLQARRDELIVALTAHCPDLRCIVPQGGLYVWAQLPHPILAHEVEAAAASLGVAIRSGDAFLPDGGTSIHIRLCYAAPAQDEISVGVQRLGKALRAVVQRHRDPAAQTSTIAPV